MRRRFAKLSDGLAKTRTAIVAGIRAAVGLRGSLDDEALEKIEETLIEADVGVETSAHLVQFLRENSRTLSAGSERAVTRSLCSEIERLLIEAVGERGETRGQRPLVVMIVGVNGVGKTTTIGKLAGMRVGRGERVVLACADTFRAAAREQLSIWAARTGAELVGGHSGGDPAAVAFDALDAAISRPADVLMIDTAGRLHTQKNLMEELRKIKRVLGRQMPGAPHEVLLVLDANTGQNGLSQARLFDGALDITGIVLAKLDGTAGGGIVVAIAKELGIPVRYVGTGEGLEDIEDFDGAAFAQALLGVESDRCCAREHGPRMTTV